MIYSKVANPPNIWGTVLANADGLTRVVCRNLGENVSIQVSSQLQLTVVFGTCSDSAIF